MTYRLFTSESVTEGHPDKIADQISDSILDALIAKDPRSRVAVETVLTTGLVHVVGEVSTHAYVEIPQLVRDVITRIGYTSSEVGFDGASCGVTVAIGQQSPEIARGVDESHERRQSQPDVDDLDAQGAGDQGIMFGYATDETPELMPLPIVLSHRIAERLTQVRQEGILDFLRPDGKTQVTVRYEDDRPVAIDTVLVSTQHSDQVDSSELERGLIDHVINPVLQTYADSLALDIESVHYIINPSGRFVIGGPMGDAGLTGRKIIVDTYGGSARHGGGAFSGKDPSKVDRSGAYAMRWVAKNVVAAGLARRIELQVSYAIGKARPISIHVDAFGTEQVAVDVIERAIAEVFDLRPLAIIADLDLLRPIYGQTATYGHFGRELPHFTWEKTNRVAELRQAAGL